jgi:hypothetical protein
MLLKLLTYSGLLFSGTPKNHFKKIRSRKDLHGLIDIHHIIPREFKCHPTIRFSKYNIEDGYNLMFLPTSKGIKTLNTHTDRPDHSSGHTEYNKYVKSVLNEMFMERKTSEYNMCELNKILRENMRHLTCPW